MNEVFRQLLHRAQSSHKHDFGHVLVIGGSPGLVGAPLLAARAAMRVGAGLVTIGSSPEVIDKLEKRVTEIMTLRLTESAAEMQPFIKDRKVSVVVVGPGLGPAFAKVVLEQLQDFSPHPVIVDGGALAVLQKNRNLFSRVQILTPHMGEFQRFFDQPLSQGELTAIIADFAIKHKIILALKGNPTYVCAPDGEVYENNSGGPALATAGAGDVLSGIIGGVIAQKIEPFEAAKAAVYLHGLAGGLAAKSKTETGVIASDVIEAIPAALKLVLEKEL